MRKKHLIWVIVYGVILTAYTAFVLLDAFVIPKSIVSPEMQETQESNGESGPDDADEEHGNTIVTTDTSYESGSISINLETKRIKNTQVYLADVVIKEASCLRAGLADGVFGRNVKARTSVIAEENDAIFAVNGDYYGYRDSGYVMRNGYLYRTEARSGTGNEDLVVYEDGSFEIVDENEVTAEELQEKGAVHIFSFGPGLINDGMITVDENTEVQQSMLSNPRCAVGMVEPLHYKFVVSDGRTDESEGLKLFELAQVMEDEDCVVAYNLGGGGSATMWFMGEIVNFPTTDGGELHERRVSDIVYIGE